MNRRDRREGGKRGRGTSSLPSTKEGEKPARVFVSLSVMKEVGGKGEERKGRELRPLSLAITGKEGRKKKVDLLFQGLHQQEGEK